MSDIFNSSPSSNPDWTASFVKNTVYFFLILKIDKHKTAKENYNLSLLNMAAKVTTKILSNQTQKYTKRIIHHDEVF